MKNISIGTITEAVEKLAIEACYNIGSDVQALLHKGLESEESDFGKNILSQLIENINISKNNHIPICQDTGMAVVFVEIGQEVHITGGSLYDAINEGIRRGYTKGYLRKSVLTPLARINTGDNTPAVIHTEITDGSSLKITVAPKGFGSENMSRVAMLTPSQGIEGIKKFVVDSVILAGANPCPPVILGIGIGGTMEKAAYLAKKALLRKAGSSSEDPMVAELEQELLEMINATGIGPQGLGGRVTALAVHINTYPTHIAGLPVAVNFQCHAARHHEIIL